jgi:hypothetical protein
MFLLLKISERWRVYGINSHFHGLRCSTPGSRIEVDHTPRIQDAIPLDKGARSMITAYKTKHKTIDDGEK